MTEPLASWIAGYRRAWESNDPADIEALFTPDARYEPAPAGEAWVGHAAIVAGWLEARDEPGDAEFAFEVLVDTPELGVAQGVSTYAAGPVYDNLWVIRRAADGRATAFTDWWIERPRNDPAALALAPAPALARAGAFGRGEQSQAPTRHSTPDHTPPDV